MFRCIYSTYIDGLVPDYFMSRNSQSKRRLDFVWICLSQQLQDRQTFLTENWYSNVLSDNSGIIIRTLSTAMANV